MSVYKEVKTEFRNLDSLKKALADVGFKEIEVDVSRSNSLFLKGFGYEYNNLNVRKGTIAIRKSEYGGYEDTGFSWDAQSKSFTAIISTHYPFNEEKLTQVKQRYAYHEVTRNARVRGYNIKETTDVDGTIRLQLVRR